MAGPRAIRAGQAFVEIFGEDAKLERTLQRARQNLRAFGRSATAMGASMTAAVSASVAPIALLSVQAASQATEIRNRFAQVFGSQADAAGAFADDLAKAVGRSGVMVRQTMSDFQGMFAGLGFGAEEARRMSERLTQLSLDFASFNNLSDAEASGRFISAMAGSSQVLDRFGINIKQSALDLELQQSGLAASTAAADEMSKAMARAAIISRAMATQGAVGDAERTSGQLANQLRRVQGEVFDLRVAIGSALVPAVERGVDAINGVISAATEWTGRNEHIIVNAVKMAAVVGAAGAAIAAMGTAALVLANPIALAAAAVGALTAALVGTDAGRSAFLELGRDIRGTLDTVLGLLAHGELEMAMSAAGAGMHAAFLEELNRIKADFRSWIDDMLGDSGLNRLRAEFGVFALKVETSIRDSLDTAATGGDYLFAGLLDFFKGVDGDTSRVEEAERREQERLRNMRRRNEGLDADGLVDMTEDLLNQNLTPRLDESRRRLDEFNRQLERLRREREAEAEARRQAREGDEERAGSGRQAMRGVAFGDLDPFTALQKMFGARQDKLTTEVSAIRAVVQRIEQNTSRGAAFT